MCASLVKPLTEFELKRFKLALSWSADSSSRVFRLRSLSPAKKAEITRSPYRRAGSTHRPPASFWLTSDSGVPSGASRMSRRYVVARLIRSSMTAGKIPLPVRLPVETTDLRLRESPTRESPHFKA